MTERSKIYSSLRSKMEHIGFVFKMEQNPMFQSRELELRFSHPYLIEKLKNNNLSTQAKKFYIKALTDSANSEIGFVTGKSTALDKSIQFNNSNANDSYKNLPAWVNRENDMAIDKLLKSIELFLYDVDIFPEVIDEVLNLYEGLKTTVSVNKYERNHVARTKCIEFHGCSCAVCGFDFQKVYGEIGKKFIHVHHITPLHTINEKYKVDYKLDLIPVCPNCHAMLHKKLDGKEPTVDELKKLIAKNIN